MEILISLENILESSYAQKVREWRNQDFVRLQMVNQDIITEEQHRKYLDSLKGNKNKESFVVVQNHTAPIGVLNFTINYDENYIEPGTYIVDEALLGKGYGLILNLVKMEYIFRVMPEGEMRTFVLQSNEYNIQLQKKLGAEIRCHRKMRDHYGNEKDAVEMFITKEMWDQERQKVIKLCQVFIAHLKKVPKSEVNVMDHILFPERKETIRA
ncbi:MAG: GNAT family N-acetyltransferase [Oscillospiraceae bacterium]|nr:GNAT family N-acetyltransferase [Oscillospiraceae bacterium]